MASRHVEQMEAAKPAEIAAQGLG